MQVSAREYTKDNVAEMQANAIATRRKLMGPAPRKSVIKIVSNLEIEEAAASPVPELLDCNAEFAARLNRWRAATGQENITCREYTKLRAAELKIPFSVLIGVGRKPPIVMARHLIMWEIKMLLRPGISYPEIGRVFGNRDHTTVLAAVRKIEAMKAMGEI